MSATCKGCGKPIVWAKGERGPVPLDAAAPVYQLLDGDGWRLIPVDGRRERGPMVSHFATCTKPGDFANSGRGVVEAVNYVARECLVVSFARGRVDLFHQSDVDLNTDPIASGESIEEAVAAFISKRAAQQRREV